MSWKLIKSIQKQTDLRLILPFGLSVKLGDVVSVGKDGNFTLEGSCKTLLGMPAGRPRPREEMGVNLTQVSGESTQYAFRAAGTASSLFPNLPSAQAGFDISFGAADSWLLALVDRVIDSLDEVNRFRRPILEAYKRNVWRPDWALVISVATVEKMTLIASSSANATVALSLGATVVQDAPVEAKLTSDVSIVQTNQQIVQRITSNPTIAFCSALRVKDPWWRSPYISTLERRGIDDAINIDQTEENEFWEDVDVIS
jgi:hypothetical protein